MFKHLVTFGAGVYVGIYLDQNRQIQPLQSPKELINYCLDELDKFLTGAKGEVHSRPNPIASLEDDFFKDASDWFSGKKKF